jgi:quinol monooxygenase YgiN
VSAFNVVRFRVKAGQEERFIDAHRKLRPKFKGFLNGNLIRTGDQTFCMVGEWRNMQSIAAARPEMIGFLNTFRDLLEDLGGGLGVTDPVSGEAVAKFSGTKKKKKKVKVQSGKKTGKTKAKKAQKKKAGKKRKK